MLIVDRTLVLHVTRLRFKPVFSLTLLLIGKFSIFLETIVLKALKRCFMCPNFLTNRVLKYIKCRIFTNLLSFLKPIILEFKNIKKGIFNAHEIVIRNMKNFNTEKLVEDLSVKFINYEEDDTKSINEQFENFLSLFTSVVNAYAPLCI